MVLLSLLMFPAMVRGTRARRGLLIDLPLFFAATLSVAASTSPASAEADPDWRPAARYLPLLMSIGIGLSVNNARAVLEACASGGVQPHPQVRGRAQRRRLDGGRIPPVTGVQPLIELALGLYFTGAVLYALANGIYGSLPFLVLFQVGFLYTGLLSVFQQFRRRRHAQGPAGRRSGK